VIGIVFLYGIWAVLAIGSVIVTAMILKDDA
jgi:nucleotide-binding universal stress UspA family protein